MVAPALAQEWSLAGYRPAASGSGVALPACYTFEARVRGCGFATR